MPTVAAAGERQRGPEDREHEDDSIGADDDDASRCFGIEDALAAARAAPPRRIRARCI